jgi:hypothetical protein
MNAHYVAALPHKSLIVYNGMNANSAGKGGVIRVYCDYRTGK